MSRVILWQFLWRRCHHLLSLWLWLRWLSELSLFAAREEVGRFILFIIFDWCIRSILSLFMCYMAFIVPVHCNKPNMSYLLTCRSFYETWKCTSIVSIPQHRKTQIVEILCSESPHLLRFQCDGLQCGLYSSGILAFSSRIVANISELNASVTKWQPVSSRCLCVSLYWYFPGRRPEPSASFSNPLAQNSEGSYDI